MRNRIWRKVLSELRRTIREAEEEKEESLIESYYCVGNYGSNWNCCRREWWQWLRKCNEYECDTEYLRCSECGKWYGIIKGEIVSAAWTGIWRWQGLQYESEINWFYQWAWRFVPCFRSRYIDSVYKQWDRLQKHFKKPG